MCYSSVPVTLWLDEPRLPKDANPLFVRDLRSDDLKSAHDHLETPKRGFGHVDDLRLVAYWLDRGHDLSQHGVELDSMAVMQPDAAQSLPPANGQGTGAGFSFKQTDIHNRLLYLHKTYGTTLHEARKTTGVALSQEAITQFAAFFSSIGCRDVTFMSMEWMLETSRWKLVSSLTHFRGQEPSPLLIRLEMDPRLEMAPPLNMRRIRCLVKGAGADVRSEAKRFTPADDALFVEYWYRNLQTYSQCYGLEFEVSAADMLNAHSIRRFNATQVHRRLVSLLRSYQLTLFAARTDLGDSHGPIGQPEFLRFATVYRCLGGQDVCLQDVQCSPDPQFSANMKPTSIGVDSSRDSKGKRQLKVMATTGKRKPVAVHNSKYRKKRMRKATVYNHSLFEVQRQGSGEVVVHGNPKNRRGTVRSRDADTRDEQETGCNERQTAPALMLLRSSKRLKISQKDIPEAQLVSRIPGKRKREFDSEEAATTEGTASRKLASETGDPGPDTRSELRRRKRLKHRETCVKNDLVEASQMSRTVRRSQRLRRLRASKSSIT